ncbi:MAG: hypothetical protein EOP11_13835 [Proteobacteria bacterium]|nr:MAG: hypothetical protein EOP11_13835 [Pseudomonadota bacterium]
MAFSKRAVVFLASAFLLPSFAFASGFVGNGGDGVEIVGKLYLHDLAEAGLHRDPYVGNKISPSIPAWPRALDSLKLSHEPLLRKLSDLDQSYPGFADYLVATIKLYTWSLEEFELTPIPDPEGPV